MAQELAFYLLRAIETFDPSKGRKPVNYYLERLQYGVLNINRDQTRLCRLANLKAFSFVSIDENGDESIREIPYHEDFDAELSTREFTDALSEREKTVLDYRLNDRAITDKRQKGYLRLIQKKAARFYAAGGI
jgi:DNA-directed RNA polymerase specialized sigma subunit